MIWLVGVALFVLVVVIGAILYVRWALYHLDQCPIAPALALLPKTVKPPEPPEPPEPPMVQYAPGSTGVRGKDLTMQWFFRYR